MITPDEVEHVPNFLSPSIIHHGYTIMQAVFMVFLVPVGKRAFSKIYSRILNKPILSELDKNANFLTRDPSVHGIV